MNCVFGRHRRAPWRGFAFLLTAWLCVVPAAFAQSADDGFHPQLDDIAMGAILQPDGKIITHGWFTEIDGAARTYVARLLPDGRLDTGFPDLQSDGMIWTAAFDPNANGSVWALALQPDGKVLIGGNFTKVGGQSHKNLARVNAGGSVDGSFTVGTDNQVTTLALQVDGKILIGGDFTVVNGAPRSRIARLNSDGSVDAGFGPGADYRVESFAALPDGKILVGGGFSQIGGEAHAGFARLGSNGVVDPDFTPGIAGGPYAIAVQPDGKLLVAGNFQQGIARLHPDGSLDATSNPGASSAPRAMLQQPDGKLVVGGGFTTIGNEPRDHIARFSSPIPATQLLTFAKQVNSNRYYALWALSGASPLLGRAPSVSWSLDGGATYSNPVTMESFFDGWIAPDLSLPQDQTVVVRVRGESVGGEANGSRSLLQSMLQTRTVADLIFADGFD